jgi:hypothetical protein
MMLHPDIERVAILGWRLYPRTPRGKSACFKSATDAATSDLDTLERWSRDYPGCGWRVVCEGSGIFALDVDAPSPDHAADGLAAMAALVERYGPIPARPMTRSGGGGCALFFRDTGQRITGKTGTPRPGIDPRRGRLSVTIPPTIHHRTGVTYRWVTPPWELTPPAAPDWLLTLIAEPEERAPVFDPGDTTAAARGVLIRSIGNVLSAGEGGRNDRLNREAYVVGIRVGRGLLSEQEAAAALVSAAHQIGLPRPEAAATIRSGLRAGQRAAR